MLVYKTIRMESMYDTTSQTAGISFTQVTYVTFCAGRIIQYSIASAFAGQF